MLMNNVLNFYVRKGRFSVKNTRQIVYNDIEEWAEYFHVKKIMQIVCNVGVEWTEYLSTLCCSAFNIRIFVFMNIF